MLSTRPFAQQAGSSDDNQLAIIQAARHFTCLGFKVLPWKYPTRPAYPSQMLRYIDHLPSYRLTEAFLEGAIGVELGPRSRNLFILRSRTIEDFKELEKILDDKLKWVSMAGHYYYSWFLLKEGMFDKEGTTDIDLLFEGSIVIPPSVWYDGKILPWLKKDGDLPPMLDKSEIEALFPGAKIKPSYLSRKPGAPIVYRSPLCRQYHDWALGHPWSGHTGMADQAVFIACCQRADLESINCFRASVREVSVLAGVSKMVASRALKRLCESGKIKRVPHKGYPRYAISFALERNAPNRSSPAGQIDLSAFLNHDIFSPKGLKPTRASIYATLLKGPGSRIDEISKRSGRAPKTTRSALKELEQVGLISHRNGQWVAEPYDPDQLDQIAQTLGTAGALAAKEERYKADRRQNALDAILSDRDGSS